MAQAQASYQNEHRQTGVALRAVLKVNEPARLWASDGVYEVEVTGDVIQRATGRGFDADRAGAQLRRTGGTAYRMDRVDMDADADAFAPASLLNALRRDALSRLDALRCEIRRETRRFTPPEIRGENSRKPALLAQSGNPELLKRALAWGADAAVFCPEDLRALDSADLPERFALAIPAVLTGEALDRLNAWANSRSDRIEATLLSNVGQLGLQWPGRRVGDYMLNVGNDISVSQLSDWGLEAFTPSVELTAAQIARLGGRTQLVMWGRIPLMHLRHCPLRAARGMKGRHADCRHCDGCKPGEALNARALVDRKGAAFPLQRLAMPGGCVIQVLNSVPLMPLKRLDRLPGTSGWRLLLRADEPAETEVAGIADTAESTPPYEESPEPEEDGEAAAQSDPGEPSDEVPLGEEDPADRRRSRRRKKKSSGQLRLPGMGLMLNRRNKKG